MPDTIRVFVPVGMEPAPEVRAQRGALRNSTSFMIVGLLDNHKRNTGKILDRIQQRLSQQYGGVRFVRAKKPEAGKPAPESVIEDLVAQCQVVVNGIGD